MGSKEVKQEPFLIDITLLTGQNLGEYITGKLETTQAWVVPIYDGKPTEEQICKLLEACNSIEPTPLIPKPLKRTPYIENIGEFVDSASEVESLG